MIKGTTYNKSYQCKGTGHPNSKLNADKAKEIREKHFYQSIGIKRLSHDYNLGRGTIQALLYGMTWKHAGGPIVAIPRRL